jgi:hypothetical protein
MRFASACVATLVAITTAGSVPASAQTVDELVAKYYAARGGYDKIKAIQTLKITQTVANPFTSSTKVVILKKRPDRVRWDVTPAGQTTAIPRAINAEGGWDTQQGKVVPRPEIMLKEDRDIDADLDGPLVDWKAKGHTVTFEGTEKLGQGQGYKLKVVTKSGATREILLDGKTYLPVREAGRMSLPPDPKGNPRFNQHVFTYSDWRDVNGVKFPFAVDEERTGGPITQSLATYVEKIEVNVPVEDAVFAKPSGA